MKTPILALSYGGAAGLSQGDARTLGISSAIFLAFPTREMRSDNVHRYI
jgi:hypothetical protein